MSAEIESTKLDQSWDDVPSTNALSPNDGSYKIVDIRSSGLKIEQGQRYLVTLDNYFYAPDGEMYKAVWGKVSLTTTEQVLGFAPSRPSTNWFMVIGEGENSAILAGCQIHFLVKCEKRPIEKTGTYLRTDLSYPYPNNSIWFTE